MAFVQRNKNKISLTRKYFKKTYLKKAIIFIQHTVNAMPKTKQNKKKIKKINIGVLKLTGNNYFN